VREARTGIGAGEKISLETLIMREGQLLLGYPDSPLSAQDIDVVAPSGAATPGMRAPDAKGLRQDPVNTPIRWHEMLRHPDHTLLLWVPDPSHHRPLLELADTVAKRTQRRVRCRVVLASDVEIDDVSGITLRDQDGNLGRTYDLDGIATPGAVLIRPDGYIGYRTSSVDADRILAHLSATFVLEPP